MNKCNDKRPNSVYTLLMLQTIYRQADVARIWTQCAKLHVKCFPPIENYYKEKA